MTAGDTGRAMSQENIEVVRAVLDAYNRGDLEAAFEHVTDGFELDWSRSLGPLGGVYRGRQGMERLYREYAEAFTNVHIEVEEFIDAGDAVVVPNVGRVRGRDGIAVEARSTIVWTIRNGEAVHAGLYQHKAEALEALGLRA